MGRVARRTPCRRGQTAPRTSWWRLRDLCWRGCRLKPAYRISLIVTLVHRTRQLRRPLSIYSYFIFYPRKHRRACMPMWHFHLSHSRMSNASSQTTYSPLQIHLSLPILRRRSAWAGAGRTGRSPALNAIPLPRAQPSSDVIRHFCQRQLSVAKTQIRWYKGTISFLSSTSPCLYHGMRRMCDMDAGDLPVVLRRTVAHLLLPLIPLQGLPRQHTGPLGERARTLFPTSTFV